MSGRPAIAGGSPVRKDPLGYGGQDIGPSERNAIVGVLESEYITRGPRVETFEREVADYIGVNHAIATSSGTAALHLVGEALDLGPGDEVITTPLTFVATANLACYAGATPVFADIDPTRRSLDPDAVRERVTEDTKAIVPMHYGGHPADVERLLGVADEFDLSVAWDACHAFGGTWQGEPLGAQPNISVFSFHPVKNLTTGEGGMVVTDDDVLAGRVRRLRSFDMNYVPEGHEEEPWYQVVEGLGYNYNITDFQAALGLVQLDRLPEFRARREEIVNRYESALAEIAGIQRPPSSDDIPEEASPMYHLYAIEVTGTFGCTRREFVEAMHAENVYVQVHYVPLHYHPYFQSKFGYERGDYPNAERLYDRLVSLPLHTGMSDDDVDDVVYAVRRIASYVS